MFDPNSLHGVIPPICTPLTAGGEVDVPSVHNLVDYLVENGVHGIFALGSTGEFSLLTNRQKEVLLDAVTEAVDHRVPVVVGILDTSTSRCIENGQVARQAGADALVLGSIYYFTASQKEVMDHFRAVHAAVGLPILAYDIPSLVHSKLDVGTIRTLFEEGVIIGIKDSSGMPDKFREVLVATRGTGFRAFTGSELVFDVYLGMGAHGGVPGLGNVLPAEYVHIYDLAQEGDWAAAAQVQERLMAGYWDLVSQGDQGYSFLSSALGGFKAGLKAKGVIANSTVGAPLHCFGPEEEERVAEILRCLCFV